MAINAQELAVLAVREYQLELRKILQRDKALPKDNTSLWPDVAELTRNLSLDTSPEFANKVLDAVFQDFPSKKLWSHIWSILPGSTIIGLSTTAYRSDVDIYGEKTKHPQIRRDLLDYLAKDPADPFIEFGHYTIGDLEKALEVNPDSTIKDVLRYGLGHRILSTLVRDAMKIALERGAKFPWSPETTNDKIALLNRHPKFYDNKPFGTLVPQFSERANAAIPYFKAVLNNKPTPHADDAAYMLGWLAQHLGKHEEARAYYSQAIKIGDDYGDWAAKKQVVRSLQRLPSSKQIAILEKSEIFKKEPAFWYTTTRSAYRHHDYANAIRYAQQALSNFNIPDWQLPVTTDPDRIVQGLERIDKNWRDKRNMHELVYLLNASKEMQRYEKYLQSLSTRSVEQVTKKARKIIVKFSRLDEEKESDGQTETRRALVHKDFRQALHMIKLSIEQVPATVQYAKLRQWLHYRKIRILVRYAPSQVAAAYTNLEGEFPNSNLLDDALTEQLYAEGVIMSDLTAMRATFAKIKEKFTNSNSIDNAYNWMVIVLKNEGKHAEAKTLNLEMIRRFLLTRMGKIARERRSKL